MSAGWGWCKVQLSCRNGLRNLHCHGFTSCTRGRAARHSLSVSMGEKKHTTLLLLRGRFFLWRQTPYIPEILRGSGWFKLYIVTIFWSHLISSHYHDTALLFTQSLILLKFSLSEIVSEGSWRHTNFRMAFHCLLRSGPGGPVSASNYRVCLNMITALRQTGKHTQAESGHFSLETLRCYHQGHLVSAHWTLWGKVGDLKRNRVAVLHKENCRHFVIWLPYCPDYKSQFFHCLASHIWNKCNP